MLPLSLYIHVPFCTRRCSYCSFYHVPSAHAREEQFIDALVDEIASVRVELDPGHALRTIFVGGGTPTTLSDASWLRLLAAVDAHLPRAHAMEFTVEMNPEDVTPGRVQFLRGLGVNRASLGIQSMHPVGQKVLKRCTPEDNVRAIGIVRSAWENVSFDVLLGVPRTVLADTMATVASLLAFAPAHLSVYGLEPGGDLSHEVERFFLAVDPDRVADEYLGVCDALAHAGYGHYEVSNFARPGFESVHNRVYWDRGDYLGVGPAAHSSLAGRRFSNAPDLDAYVQRRGAAHREARIVDADTAPPMEALMLALRTDRGVPVASVSAPAVHEFVDHGLARVENGVVRLTDPGYLMLNDIVLRLAEPAHPAPGRRT